MRLLLILEQHFTTDGMHTYVDVQCDSTYWNRYLEVFDEITVFARFYHSKNIDKKNLLISDKKNVNFSELPEFRGFWGALKHLPGLYIRLIKEAKNADAILMRIPSPISLASFPAIVYSKKPFAVEMMMNPKTAYSKESMRQFLQPFIQFIAVNFTKIICMEANGVSYVTENYLQEHYPCRALKDKESEKYFTASYSTINLRKNDIKKSEWSIIPPTPLILVHSGKMSDYRKGHIEFLKIVYEVNKRGIETRAILIGDGSKRKEFEQFAKILGIYEKTDFVGWKTGFKNVQKELQRGHIFVFPTKSEGLPRALIEAMASGLLCVASSVDGIPELLPDQFLSPNNCVNEFVDIILQTYMNWNTIENIRDSNIKTAKNYQSNLLNKRRFIFYGKLHVLAEKKVAN